MIVLKLKDTGAEVGRVTEDDFRFLVEQLEEESDEDTDYFIDLATVEMLDKRGGSLGLMDVLERAVGTSQGVEISWNRD